MGVKPACGGGKDAIPTYGMLRLGLGKLSAQTTNVYPARAVLRAVQILAYKLIASCD